MEEIYITTFMQKQGENKYMIVKHYHPFSTKCQIVTYTFIHTSLSTMHYFSAINLL
jgi:hypothetical protein